MIVFTPGAIYLGKAIPKHSPSKCTAQLHPPGADPEGMYGTVAPSFGPRHGSSNHGLKSLEQVRIPPPPFSLPLHAQQLLLSPPIPLSPTCCFHSPWLTQGGGGGGNGGSSKPTPALLQPGCIGSQTQLGQWWQQAGLPSLPGPPGVLHQHGAGMEKENSPTATTVPGQAQLPTTLAGEGQE